MAGLGPKLGLSDEGSLEAHRLPSAFSVIGINLWSMNRHFFSLRYVRNNSVFMLQFPLHSALRLGCNSDEGSFDQSLHESVACWGEYGRGTL